MLFVKSDFKRIEGVVWALLAVCSGVALADGTNGGAGEVEPLPKKELGQEVVKGPESKAVPDFRGVVDHMITEEQTKYSRDNTTDGDDKTEPSKKVTEAFDINQMRFRDPVLSGPGPDKAFGGSQSRSRHEGRPHFVGLFGQRGDYYVEIYFDGSSNQYTTGDRIPGGFVIVSIDPRRVVVRDKKGSKHDLFLTSKAWLSSDDASQNDRQRDRF